MSCIKSYRNQTRTKPGDQAPKHPKTILKQQTKVWHYSKSQSSHYHMTTAKPSCSLSTSKTTWRNRKGNFDCPHQRKCKEVRKDQEGSHRTIHSRGLWTTCPKLCKLSGELQKTFLRDRLCDPRFGVHWRQNRLIERRLWTFWRLIFIDFCKIVCDFRILSSNLQDHLDTETAWTANTCSWL